MKIYLHIFLLTIVTVAAMSVIKPDIPSREVQPGKFRKHKLFYNFWIPLPGLPTQPPGGTTTPPPTGISPCNTTTFDIITTPTCSCGGPTCIMGQVCVDPATTMTCTTPLACAAMTISNTPACTCGTARRVCRMGELCMEATSDCVLLPQCLDSTTYTTPCRCGTGLAPCGLDAPMPEACTIGSGICSVPSTTLCTDGDTVTEPCICRAEAGQVPSLVCPTGGMCTAEVCTLTVTVTAPPTIMFLPFRRG